MIKREKYIAPIREFYNSDLIKIITGIRRCGKSVILEEILEEIKDKSDNIIYLIDYGRLLRYARRRNKTNEVKKYIGQFCKI